MAARVPGARALHDFVARYRRPPLLQHPLGRRRPRLTGVLSADRAASSEDVAIATRLLAAYQDSVAWARPTVERSDIWTDIQAGQKHFLSILHRANPEELAGYLCNMSRHDALRGISQGDIEFERIVAGIEARLELDITPPDIDGGLLKLQAGTRAFSDRDLSAVYSAHLLQRASPTTGEARICEIGGGAGRLAYWSHRLGMKTYTIIDLPHVNVVQGYYLLKALPCASVLLYGEARSTSLHASLRILPAHAISDDHAHKYDVVVNEDSFPEMDPATVREYLSWIKTCCRGRLMSVNHENKPPYGNGRIHVSVPETIQELGGFRLRQRFPYWLRKGYVMELYEPLD